MTHLYFRIVATSVFVLYRSGSDPEKKDDGKRDSVKPSQPIEPVRDDQTSSPAPSKTVEKEVDKKVDLIPIEDPPIITTPTSKKTLSSKINSSSSKVNSSSALSSPILQPTSQSQSVITKRSSSDSKTNSSTNIHENSLKKTSKNDLVRKSDSSLKAKNQETPVAKGVSVSDVSDKTVRADKTPSKSNSKKSLHENAKIGNKSSSRPSSAKQSLTAITTLSDSPSSNKESEKKASKIPSSGDVAKASSKSSLLSSQATGNHSKEQHQTQDQNSAVSSKSDLSKETFRSPTKIIETMTASSALWQSEKQQDFKLLEHSFANIPAPTVAEKLPPSPESPELSPTHRVVTLPERRMSLSREELQKISPSCEFYPDFIDRDSLTTVFGRFDENESQETVWKNDKNGKRVLVAATPLRYLEQVIEENDARTMNNFLAYYHDLFSPEELLELLIYRYLKLGTERKAYHKNVLNMFKIWVLSYWRDFESSRAMRSKILQFLQDLPKGRDKYVEPSLDIENIIINNIQSFGSISDSNNGRWRFVIDGSKSSSVAEETIIGLEKIGIKEFCETWTLQEFDLFSRVSFIRPEGLGLVINEKKGGGVGLQSRRGSRALTESQSNTIRLEEGNKNLDKKIETFNRMSKFFSISILKKKSVKDRAAIIKKLIQICEQLRYLQNFDGMMCIMSCLQSVPIYRLKKTWAAVPNSFMKSFEEYGRLLSPVSGYREYRNALHQNTERPALPYLGVYLTDLTFIQDGNNDFYHSLAVSSNGSQPLLNLEKRRLFSKVFKEIYRFQSRPYSTLKCDEKTQAWLSNCLIVALGYTRDEYLMKLSIEREPKLMV